MKTASEMVERMERLVRKMAQDHRAKSHFPEWIFDQARQIASELPEPVDPDLLETRRIAARWGSEPYYLSGSLLEAIKLGRELERSKLQHGEG